MTTPKQPQPAGLPIKWPQMQRQLDEASADMEVIRNVRAFRAKLAAAVRRAEAAEAQTRASDRAPPDGDALT